jgi:DNA repair exonuclease SbcCD ATPase subunit
MSTSPNVPEPGETYRVEAHGTPRWIIVVVVVLVAGMGYLIYAQSTSRRALEADINRANQRTELLANKLEQTESRLNDVKGQLDVTSQKLGLTQDELARARDIAQNLKKQQATSEKQLTAKIGEVQQQSEAKIGQVATDLGGAKSDIEATKKDLEETKGKLSRSMGDMNVMSGLIARNKEEVDELKRRGERNIFDFDLKKSGKAEHVGPILIKVKKVDPKRQKYTMDVVADDKTIEKKDKNTLEPVQFYTRSTHQLYEIVVFDMSKDHISGYLSTPKQ